MDLISHIAGVGPTGAVNPGATTPAPYNVPHVGAVDGMGPGSATKNMAELYNRNLLWRRALIASAGLAFDPTNWVQEVDAITALAKSVIAGANKATNPEFSINQNEVASPYVAAAGVYGHDGWKAGAGGVTYSFATALGLTTATITAGTLLHPVEADAVDSSTVTISWTGTAQARVGAGAYAASPVTVTGLALNTQYNVEFSAGTLTRLKIENGSLATPYVKRDTSTEMERCLRFYFRVPASASGHDIAVPTNLSAGLSPGFRITIPHSTPMRQNPSITILTQVQSDRAASSLSPNSGSTRFAMTLQADVAAGSGVAQWINVRWALDARL